MTNSPRPANATADLAIVCYERDQGFVLQRFREGEFDYVDAASEVFEADFFRFIQARGYLAALAGTYPSPRKKEEVPTWFYLASNVSLRLHGVHGFHAYPYVVRCGGMLNVFGPRVGHKATHPDTGDVTLRCAGFNAKNDYQRQTPCDQDFLRKLAKDTDPEQLTRWFNRDVPRLLKQHHAFDRDGLFIGDATYVFVPDNANYERAVRLLFDEHGHPVEADQLARMAPAAAARCTFRRCYKLVSLLHTDRARRFCLRVAMQLVPGNESECPILYALVDEFVADVGDDVIKRLLLDRGFLDGEKIASCKRVHGIDILIPLRKNMDVYQDALGLLRLPEMRFREYTAPAREPVDPPRLPQAPARVRTRELARQRTIAAEKDTRPPSPPAETLVRTEVAGMGGFTSWRSCSLPLTVIVNRDVYADGHTDTWMLVDTKPLATAEDPAARRDEYALRTEIEEGHRQLKCFWDLAGFTSRAFSLVLNQIVFVMLAFNLLQLFLRTEGKQAQRELPRRSRPRQLDRLFSSASVIIIYCDTRFAILTPLEYTELLLTLSDTARHKILEKTRRLRRDLVTELRPARAP